MGEGPPVGVVEAAARRARDRYDSEHDIAQWEQLSEGERESFRDDARNVLSAVPWDRWEALRKAAREVCAIHGGRSIQGGRRSVEYLQAALDALEDDNGDG